MLSNHPKGFFITGTDTNAGKTTITKMLLSELISNGYSSIACKPIACGDHSQDSNQDALHFLETNSINLPLSVISPLRFNLPVSPHIAAKAAGKTICAKELSKQLLELYQLPLDYILFEGAGGWRVPLNDNETFVDLVKLLELRVILVVGIRVGCLNHALLTTEALSQDNVQLSGWVANLIEEDTPEVEEHIATLRAKINAPFLGTVPYLSRNDQTCYLDIKPLI